VIVTELNGSDAEQMSQGFHRFCKVPKMKKKILPVEVLKLAIGPEEVLIFGQSGPEKLTWPTR